jgi:hypothetical protein
MSSEQDIYSQALKPGNVCGNNSTLMPALRDLTFRHHAPLNPQTGDKYIKYPDQIARDLFALCDVDNNGEISVSDLLRLLVLAGIDADQDDARAMMQMAGEGKESVRYSEFRRIFYQGILGQNEKEYMAGLSVAVPRAGHEVNKDRLRIRKCLMRMVWSNDINFSRMVQWLGGLNNKSIKVFQSKEETAEILQIRPDNADLECFLELFDPTSFGIHDFRFVFLEAPPLILQSSIIPGAIISSISIFYLRFDLFFRCVLLSCPFLQYTAHCNDGHHRGRGQGQGAVCISHVASAQDGQDDLH